MKIVTILANCVWGIYAVLKRSKSIEVTRTNGLNLGVSIDVCQM